MNYNRALINYSELSPEWQAAARDNDDDYLDQTYIEPLNHTNATDHVLFDLSECMRTDHPDYDGIIGVSNNSAIGVNVSPCGDACNITYI